MRLGAIVVRYELGRTWFDGSLHVSGTLDDPGQDTCIQGMDAIVAPQKFSEQP